MAGVTRGHSALLSILLGLDRTAHQSESQSLWIPFIAKVGGECIEDENLSKHAASLPLLTHEVLIASPTPQTPAGLTPWTS